MKKIDKFIDEIQALKTKGYDAKKVDALTEGVNFIAAEYRRRKMKEDAQRKAMVEAAGFAKLDAQCKASGLSRKAFVEGVGKTIIESTQPDDVKSRMMDMLEKYASHLMEAAGGVNCICSLKELDAQGKELLAKNDIQGLMRTVLARAEHHFRDAAKAKRTLVDKLAQGEGVGIGKTRYRVTRKLVDNDHEKLYVLAPDGEPNGTPYILHYADTPTTSV